MWPHFKPLRPGETLKMTLNLAPHPLDVGTMMESARQNWLALTEAQHLWLEGAQAMAHRHGAWVGDMIAAMGDLRRTQTTPEAPEDKIADQAEILQHWMDRAVRHQEELVDTWHQAARDGRRLVEKRLSATLGDVRTAVTRAKSRRTA